MLKKVLKIFGLTILIVSILPISSRATFILPEKDPTIVETGKLANDVSYVLKVDGTLTISGTGVIFPTLPGFNSTFESLKEQVISVVIEEGITQIQGKNFYGFSKMTSITIPSTLNYFGQDVFYGCTALETVYISDLSAWCEIDFYNSCANPLAYGAKLYLNGNAVTSLTWLEHISSVKKYAFYGCSSLTDVTIPASINTIDKDAFASCANLNGIWVDAENGFYSNDDYGVLFNKEKTEIIMIPGNIHGEYIIPDCVTEITDEMFQGRKSLTGIVLSTNVTQIGSRAFYGCTNLRKIEFPNSIWIIDSYAFGDCDSLQNVFIPSSVTHLDSGAFSGCDNLEGIWVDEEHKFYSSDSRGVLYNKDKTELLDAPDGISGSYVMPDSVTQISSPGLSNCVRLTEIIPSNSLSYLNNLYGCTGLKSLSIPESVTKIGSLKNCSSLETIVIPENVTWIDHLALDGCTSLDGIWVDEGNQSFSHDEHGVLFNKDKTTLWLLPRGFSGEYRVPDGVETIRFCAFYTCAELTGVTIGADVKTIESSVFAHCSSLDTVMFIGDAPHFSTPDGVALFHGVTADILYPNNNATWTEDIMQDYGGDLTWIPYTPGKNHDHDIKYTVTPATCTEKGHTYFFCECGLNYISDYTDALGHEADSENGGHCKRCGKIYTVVSENFGNGAQWELRSDGTLIITGSSVPIYLYSSSEMPWYEYRNEIKALVVREGVRSISGFAFCPNLESVTLPDSLEEIIDYTFYECTSLTEIRIPKGVTEIYEEAFAACNSLSKIYVANENQRYSSDEYGVLLNKDKTKLLFCPEGYEGAYMMPDSVTDIERVAFRNCTRLIDITLSQNTAAIGVGAFLGCESITKLTIPASVKQIGVAAFDRCTALSEVTFLGGPPIIATAAFRDVTANMYYSEDAKSWLPYLLDYEGDLTWIPYTPEKHEHSYECTVTPATCMIPGNTFYRCSYCGHSYTKNYIEPLGHDYRDGTCTRCGEPDPRGQNQPQVEAPPRVAGDNRFETANLVGDQMKQNLGIDKFDAVVVASGTEFADALAGSYLAAVKNAPILLAYTTDKINDGVKEYIRANLNQGGTVYILGGPNAVPTSFEANLEGFEIKRLAGQHRFETNLMVLKEAGIGDKPILVATGLTFADSLSASAAKLPILLVYGDKLLPDQAAFLEENRGRNLYILGGEGAVNAKMEAVLTAYGTVERVAGNNRFETSVKIAEKFFGSPESAVLAYAWDFPDGLCGGPLATTMNAPLILTMEKYEVKAAEYIQSKAITKATILGGDSLIPNDTVRLIFALSE